MTTVSFNFECPITKIEAEFDKKEVGEASFYFAHPKRRMRRIISKRLKRFYSTLSIILYPRRQSMKRQKLKRFHSTSSIKRVEV